MNQVVEVFMKPQAATAPAPANATAVQHPGTPHAGPSAQLIELAELAPSASPAATPQGAPLLPTVNPLHQVKATLQVCVGSATLTVGELLSAQAQQVLLLDRGVSQPVDLLLEGQVVARGQLVAVDDQFAVRITELPLALTLGKPGAP